MLPPFGFHDACINCLTHEGNTLTIELESVQEDLGLGEFLLFSMVLTFVGVRDLTIGGIPCQKMIMEGRTGKY
jgi:hypothetical protein